MRHDEIHERLSSRCSSVLWHTHADKGIDVTIHDRIRHPSPTDQRRSVDWARRVLESPERYVLLDTETTGLGNTAEVIQIGLLDVLGNVILDTFVRPLHRKSIPSDAARVHGITMKMLRDAPGYPEIANQIIASTKGRTVICYNADYDSRLLKQTVQQNGGAALSVRWECAMLEYARFRGEWNHEKGDYRWHKLPGGSHSALEDCRAVLALLHEMANATRLKRWYEFWVRME